MTDHFTYFLLVDQEDLSLDKENGMKYRKLCDDLVKRFPVEKLDQLKDVLLGNNYSASLFIYEKSL